MTTKEQERKALAQIRKIVDGLGENSYIGTAFEGCFEKAEQNIDDDAAYSWKGEAEYFQRAANMYAASAAETEKKLEETQEELELVQKWYEQGKKDFDNKQKELQEACERIRELIDVKCELTSQIEAKDLEIIKLKARLFDLIDKQ